MPDLSTASVRVMIFLAAPTSASPIPAWLTIAGAVAGLVGGIGGAALCVVTVRTARNAVRETQMMPVRQKQQDLIDRLVDQLTELLSALTEVNAAVQQKDGGAETRAAAESVEKVTRRMTAPEVTDRELRERLEKLKSVVLSRGNDAEPRIERRPHRWRLERPAPLRLTSAKTDPSFVERLQSYARVMDRLRDARQALAQQPERAVEHGEELVRVATQRSQEQEPLRRLNEEAISAAESVGERLRELQREGLGEIRSRRWLWRGLLS